MYRHWQPHKCRVLLSLDYAKSPTNSEVNTSFGYHVPVCWIKTIGEGKLYYNNLGHNETSWANPTYLASITEAVKWMRGMIEADARPNPEVSHEFEEKSARDFKEQGFKAAQHGNR
jgi:type 1 glutamine amidotransferase